MVSRADALALALAVSLVAQRPPAVDPFAFFRPTVTPSAADRRALDEGSAIVRLLPSASEELTILSAVRADVSGDRLVAWARRIEALKRGRYVSAIGRFSNPPRLEDLRELVLDDTDLDEIRRCRPGRCGLKLSADDIAQLHRAIAAGGQRWKGAAQDAFKRMLLRRAEAYLVDGLRSAQPYHDENPPTQLQSEFEQLLGRSEFLTREAPAVARHLRAFPTHAAEGAESLLYWSKESLGGKPIVGMTHLTIARGPGPPWPEALVVGKQIYASHYMTGALTFTAVTRGSAGARYLVYFNRSRVDVLRGFWGGLARRIMASRLRSEAVDAVQALRRRLESGNPAD
jgi:hypothetical protein